MWGIQTHLFSLPELLHLQENGNAWNKRDLDYVVDGFVPKA